MPADGTPAAPAAAGNGTEAGGAGKSVDHHEIDDQETPPDHGDAPDPSRKDGAHPFEKGNQYSHHKVEKS